MDGAVNLFQSSWDGVPGTGGFIDPVVPTTILNYTRSNSLNDGNKTDILQKIKDLIFIPNANSFGGKPAVKIGKEYKIPISTLQSLLVEGFSSYANAEIPGTKSVFDDEPLTRNIRKLTDTDIALILKDKMRELSESELESMVASMSELNDEGRRELYHEFVGSQLVAFYMLFITQSLTIQGILIVFKKVIPNPLVLYKN